MGGHRKERGDASYRKRLQVGTGVHLRASLHYVMFYKLYLSFLKLLL